MIDTDGGADDAAAILLALSAWANNDSDHEIVAITCVNGNVDQKTVQKNVLKTLTIANASDVIIIFCTILNTCSHGYFHQYRLPFMEEQ